MEATKRLEIFDVLKGFSLLGVIFFHTAVYNFANIAKIDFSAPPIIIVLISFMMLWGGIFIVASVLVNTFLLAQRLQLFQGVKALRYLLIAGLILIGMHYLLNYVFGRWSVDFVNNKPDMTLIAGSLRNLQLTFPHLSKLYEGSSLSTIALNLIIVASLVYALIKDKGNLKQRRNYLILGLSGLVIMLLSFVRISIYPFYAQAVSENNFLLASFYSFTIANPYPLLPYLAYGLFGGLIGLMIFNKRRDLLKKVILPLGLVLLIFGIAGAMNFPKSISKPDYFWYFKTNMELGLFLLVMAGSYLLLNHRKNFLNKLTIIKWFGRISLTVYMLETFVSEILRIILHGFNPDFDQTINGCLAFGAINIVVWIMILFFWQKFDFKYSLEYFWVKYFKKIGKDSTKLMEIHN